MAFEPPSPNATDRWTVRAKYISAQNGTASVEVHMSNEVGWTLPPLLMHVDWKPGAESADVEGLALLLAGQSFGYLSSILIAEGAKRSF